MNYEKPQILNDQIERDFLPFVRRPSRYIGGEVNQIKKDLSKCRLTIALCFPDLYEVAMSNLGIAILYDVINAVEGVAAERAFSPWHDAEKILREKKIPLFTLESRAALNSLDILGFSLTNELCYTNLLNTLDLSGIPLRSADRTGHHPLIIAGGQMANCCEPVAPFIDLFILGHAENAAHHFVKFLLECKKDGLKKNQLLQQAAKKFEWAYVPSLYDFEYHNSAITSFKPKIENLNTEFKNAVVDDYENAPFPTRPLVPFAEAVHERVSIEIMRGCPGRCRFCQASFCTRPLRYRSVDKIVDIAKKAYHATGFDTISLLSLSTAEYPNLEQLVSRLNEYFRKKHVGLSLPSLRVDQQLKLIPQLATSVRKSGITIAVEAASQKLRKIINKPIQDSDLFAAARAAFQQGYKKIKLYFMVGLPGETQKDITQIVLLSNQLACLRKEIDRKAAQINITISWFVPKPHTPFAWLPQKNAEYFQNSRSLILSEKRKLKAKSLNFKFHNIDRTILESVLARADRRLAKVIENAWKNGAKFDLWNECFQPEIWRQAFEKQGFDIDQLAEREFSTDEILPFEHLGSPQKKYLLNHLEQAMNIAKNTSTTPKPAPPPSVAYPKEGPGPLGPALF